MSELHTEIEAIASRLEPRAPEVRSWLSSGGYESTQHDFDDRYGGDDNQLHYSWKLE